MKKALTLILAAILLCLPLAALADDGFLALASTMMDEDILGEPNSINAAPEEFEAENVTVMVQIEEGNLLIIGRTNENELVGCYWEGRDPAKVMSLVYAMCASYEELAARCEHGLDVIVWASSAEDSAFFQVSDAETAALVVSLLGLNETAEDTGAAEDTETAVEAPAVTEAE